MSCRTADFVVSGLEDIVFFLYFLSSLLNLSLVNEVTVGQVMSAWEEAYVFALDGTNLGFYITKSLCTRGNGSFPAVRCGRGVTLTPHPLLVPRSKIEYSYTSTLPKGLCGL